MKKAAVSILLTLGTFFSYSQERATLVNDTATYLGKTYTIGDTIVLGYGSKSTKDFAFIKFGSGLLGWVDLDKAYAKYEAVIDKLYRQSKNIYMRAKLTDKAQSALNAYKLVIDLEAAVDNKEIR